MDVQKKQLAKINGLACLINCLIAGSMGVFTLMQFLSASVATSMTTRLLRILMVVADIVVNILMVKKFRYEENYRHICGCSMLAVYLLILFTATTGYMYVYVFPVAIMLMIFQDKKLTALGSVVALVSGLIYLIMSVARGYTSIDEAVLVYMIILLVCLTSPRISNMQIENTDENLRIAREKAEAQKKTSSSIVKLAEDLTKKFTMAKEVSDSLNVSMDDSHNAVSEIAESTRVNAEAITQQTEQTSGIQNSIQEVGEQARHMGEVSENTSATVQEGVQIIERLKMQALEVAKINKETKETTTQLNESIKDVEAITETILGISSQTNLLALNASIEAARAGEAGKGFAVVADEIRNLAEDTRAATEKIGEIISKLTVDAESAATSMQKSAEFAEKQNELIAETGEKLSDIKADTDVLYDDVKKVNISVDSIISANGVIMDSITDLSATGEEVAASTDTALSLSDNTLSALDNMNGLLQEINTIAMDMEKVASE